MEDSEMEADDMEGGLTASFLHIITGAEDLSSVTNLELCIDATDTSLFDLGQLLPGLLELKLLNSVLPQIRDLGTGLTHLQVLWLPRCGLQEVDGLGSLPQLRELYAAFNDIDDLAPIAGLEHLEILDLEANKVSDLDSVAFLGMCPKLRALTLEGNEVAGATNYRSSVLELIPTLTVLDERPVGPGASDVGDDVAASPPSDPSAPGDSSSLDAQRELVLVRDGIKYARPAAQETEEGGWTGVPGQRATSAPGVNGRPASAAAHLRHSYSAGFPRPWSPGVGVRPMSAFGSRSGSAAGTRPGTALPLRPGTALARQRLPEAHAVADHASELTFGSDDVFCGNPVQALRRRKANGRQAAETSSPESSGNITQIRRPGDTQGGADEHQQLLQELAEVKAQSVEENVAVGFSTDDGEGETRADIRVITRRARTPDGWQRSAAPAAQKVWRRKPAASAEQSEGIGVGNERAVRTPAAKAHAPSTTDQRGRGKGRSFR